MVKRNIKNIEEECDPVWGRTWFGNEAPFSVKQEPTIKVQMRTYAETVVKVDELSKILDKGKNIEITETRNKKMKIDKEFYFEQVDPRCVTNFPELQ